ncbi:MAG TPA: hypothetical protein DGM69_07080, partial [Chloroflexi bacterium]|nr:hypothetical protein [Chloroflexota bacterium]
MKNTGYIKFWGVRGSNPTPDSDKMHYGGDTSCVEVRTNDNDCIILDMGTGLRKLGNHILSDSSYKKEINILFKLFLRFQCSYWFTWMKDIIYSNKYKVHIYKYENMESNIKKLKNI